MEASLIVKDFRQIVLNISCAGTLVEWEVSCFYFWMSHKQNKMFIAVYCFFCWTLFSCFYLACFAECTTIFSVQSSHWVSSWVCYWVEKVWSYLHVPVSTFYWDEVRLLLKTLSVSVKWIMIMYYCEYESIINTNIDKQRM